MAVVQNLPGYDKQKNIERACALIRTAAKKGAKLIVLPEIFHYPYEMHKLAQAADHNGETLDRLMRCARDNRIFLCTGSIAERHGPTLKNTAYLLNEEGQVILSHTKVHLFDVNLPGIEVQESALFCPGSTFKVADTSIGKIGILICYDIRFPEAARAMQGVEILLVPAAFSRVTGLAHWHIFFRTRAVENQVFLAAASPARNKKSSYQAFGHSLIIDPWGKVLREAGHGEEIIYADINKIVLDEIRTRLPLLKHRRGDLY